jgi:hypothetical protein
VARARAQAAAEGAAGLTMRPDPPTLERHDGGPGLALALWSGAISQAPPITLSHSRSRLWRLICTAPASHSGNLERKSETADPARRGPSS